MKTPLVMSWSGGKDSAIALEELLRGDDYEVVELLTTVSQEYRRISHHGVRETLLDAQADAIGIALTKVYLPSGSECTNEVYERIMADAMAACRARGIHTVGFGDLFLQDLREWREANLAKADMRAVFPVWGRNTSEVAREVIRRGYKARLTCVEPKVGEGFAGREFDESLLRDLPAAVDPCGERGEFHTFVYAGPIFSRPVEIELGEIVTRDGRFYADIFAAESRPGAICVADEIPPV